jgi:hypothetical protein
MGKNVGKGRQVEFHGNPDDTPWLFGYFELFGVLDI